MEKRVWPWKKKSTKAAATKADSNGNAKSIVENVQISQERYAHLSALEDQVKVLNEKLSDALAEITNKDSLVKQHSKVAEDAVAGWEKAEAESSSLKDQLEDLMLLKLSAEEKTVQLDGALKECMKQVRNVKEESQNKLKDVTFLKNEQLENVKSEFQMRITALEQELLQFSAENELLSKSIEEHSDMLMKVSEEKSQAYAEIEALKADIQSYERETSSLSYEVHVVSKELEIRNEEKNMCARSAEVANRQHLEDVKKIVKLEAECQRLRGLVRKKLPGPAALAQMKQEVDNWGRDHAEDKQHRNSSRISSPRNKPSSDFAFENMQKLHKENEFLSARLLAMEEEAKMLKDALSDRKNELLSRDMFSRAAVKLHTVEEQMQSPNFNSPIESSPSKTPMKAQSHMSMLEDGIDGVSCCESWDTISLSESSTARKGKYSNRFSKTVDAVQLNLMDDFLEMEKLACSSSESGAPNYMSGHFSNPVRNQTVDSTTTKSIRRPDVFLSPKKLAFDSREMPFSHLQSEISLIFKSYGEDVDVREVIAKIQHILQNAHGHEESAGYPDHTISSGVKEESLDEDLKTAVIKIRDVVVSLDKEVAEMQDGLSNSSELGLQVREFCSAVDKLLSKDASVCDVLQTLSCALSETKERCLGVLRDKDNEGGSNSSDCVDKVTLLEKKVVSHEHERCRFTDPSSDSDNIQEGLAYPSSNQRSASKEDSVEYIKQLEKENKSLFMNLTSVNESFKQKEHDLLEAQQQLVALKSQLAACPKSNNLAEIQLKCMTESYTSSESRSQDLEKEINLLQNKIGTLENELKEERGAHKDNLVKLQSLQEEIERMEKTMVISESNSNSKAKQDMEIAAATEKLSECQQTIFLLGRQLKAMQPPANFRGSLSEDKHRISDGYLESILNENDTNAPNPKVENLASILSREGDDSPFNGHSGHFSSHDDDASSVTMPSTSAKRPKHRPTWSVSSTSSNATEKHGRGGFSRFFSKGKGDR